MNSNIGIAKNDQQKVVEILNILLSDEYILYTKTLNFHWNVTGKSFAELHKFLEGQYEEMQEIIDGVAERTRKVGGNALGSLKEFLQKTRLKESPGGKHDAISMLKNLLADHEAMIRELRKDLELCDKKYHDMGTTDFLTGLMEQHEKMAWMLRSYLE